jgi:hypothetical protein
MLKMPRSLESELMLTNTGGVGGLVTLAAVEQHLALAQLVLLHVPLHNSFVNGRNLEQHASSGGGHEAKPYSGGGNKKHKKYTRVGAYLA